MNQIKNNRFILNLEKTNYALLVLRFHKTRQMKVLCNLCSLCSSYMNEIAVNNSILSGHLIVCIVYTNKKSQMLIMPLLVSVRQQKLQINWVKY